MGKFSFAKEERLSKEKWIKELFERGSSFNFYPFRIIFLGHPDPNYPLHQVLISVSIRNFKRAVDRNLLKRRIREAWRHQKQQLSTDSKLIIAYIYTAREKEELSKIEAGMIKSFAAISTGKVPAKIRKESPGK